MEAVVISPPETTIDRTFDQTAPHIHAKDGTCPTCTPVELYHHQPTRHFSHGREIDLGEPVDEGNTTGDDDAGSREQYARPVSPSILEFRIQTLEKDNHRLTIENDAYRLHIQQLEALLHRLATHIDECAKLIEPARPGRQFPKAA